MQKWKNFDQFFWNYIYSKISPPPYFSILLGFFSFLYRGKPCRAILLMSAFKAVRKERKGRKRGK